MGDLPDWVQATDNPASLLTFTVLTGSANFQGDVGGDASLYLRVDGSVANTPIVLQVTWYTDATLATPIQEQTFTAIPDPGGGQFIVIQTPVYAPWVFITNATANTVSLTVVASSIIVPTPRVLDATVPTRLFQYTGARTGGVAILLPGLDGGGNGYASNATSGLVMEASVAGTISVYYVDLFDNQRSFIIATLAAGVPQNLLTALPQGIIGFEFTSTPTAGSATALVFASPAQL